MLRAPFDDNLTNYTTPTLINYKTNHIFGAKTGTDESNSYTIGFNPLYTIGVWCGNDDNTKLMYKNISKKVFQTLANSINEKNVWYTPPSYIKEINKDKIDNYSTSYWTFK
jgi:membrane peptidoglycan carboxypeptidase